MDPDAIPKNTSDWNKLFRSRLFRYNADIADVAGKKFKSPKPRKCHTFIVATADEINWAFLNSNVKIKVVNLYLSLLLFIYFNLEIFCYDIVFMLIPFQEMEGTYESRKPFELFHLTLKEDGKYSVANLRPHYVQCTLDENWNPVHYVGAIPTPRNPCLSLLLECIRNLRYLYRI